MKKQLLLSAMALLLLSACGNNEKAKPNVQNSFSLNKEKEQYPLIQNINSAKGITAPLFSIRDNAKVLTKEEFLEALNTNAYFVDTFDNADENEQACITKLIDKSISITSSENSLGFYTIDSPLVDLTSCYEKDSKKIKTSTYSDIVSFDTPQINPTSYKEFQNSSENVISRRTKAYVEAYLYDKDSKKGVSILFYILETAINNDNKPCTKINNFLSCKQKTKNIYFVDSKLFNVENNEFIQEVQSEGGLYYASGSITFKLDNWSGVMTYQGVNESPTFSATNGDESVEGVLNFKP